MALTTPTGTCASEFASFCVIVHFVRTVSAKYFPHIYNGRNLRKTAAPPVAREGRKTLKSIFFLFEEVVLIRETNRNFGIDGST